MPKAERVVVGISLRVAKEVAAGIGGDCFGLGLGNVPSLRDVYVRLYTSGVTVREAKQAKADLEKALRAHSNRPAFDVYFRPSIPEGM
jgi:hypothetical protein